MKYLLFLPLLVAFCITNVNATADQTELTQELSPEQQEYLAWAKGLWDSMQQVSGEVKLAEANVTLNVPDNFYYLSSEDAQKVLVDVWGNPPGATTLGMLFPAGQTPFDPEAWAVTIEYEEDGYVSDEDAKDLDYGDLLEQMQEDARNESAHRVEMGYESIELIGWAADPYYDASTNKLHWAKEIRFGGFDEHTLNYNIRMLGRKGVLVLNFIAGIHQKEIIQGQLDTVLAMADFDAGSTYADFDPSVDKVAAYGVGALVAGKVLAKTGFLAVALVFLKKFWIFILLGIGGLFKVIFSKKTPKTES